MKKALIVFIILSLFCGLVHADEVYPSVWAKDDIDYVLKRDLLDERLASRYNQEITRAEFAYIGVRVYENITGKKASMGQANFPDTSDPYVLKAKNLGIVDGYPDGVFAPNIYITRQEIAKLYIMALKSAGVEAMIDDETKFIDDHHIMSWAKEYVYKARSIHIIKGFENNQFKPTDYTTREQAIVMFKRIIDTYGQKNTISDNIDDTTELSEGDIAPNFTLTASTEDSVTLSDFSGQPVVLVFIADYSLCKEQLADIETIKDAYKQINFIAINIVNEQSSSTSEIADTISFSVLEDRGEASDAYQIRVVPTTVIIDGEKKIKNYNHGSISLATLKQQLDEL